MNLQTTETLAVKKLPSLAEADPKTLANAIFDVLDEKKAEDIRVLRVHDHTVITDYFIVCSGRSSTQVKSLGGEVEFKLGERDAAPAHYEGRDNGNWVVLDYGSVIVHIFSRESREFYKLEKLYGDAEEIHFESIDEKAEAETK
ncbi:MAG: ribosome silencing factor [Clostridia bacterium]|nr:ribosome silencing factor [Clostridia bacterium]